MPTLLTLSAPVNSLDVGDRQEITLDVTGDNSYATGGYDLLAGDLPLRVGNQIEQVFGKSEATGRKARYVHSTGKLIWDDAAGTEVANATDLSADTLRLTILGR